MNGFGTALQSAVDSAGASSAGIERLWWFFFWLLLAIFVIVMAVLGGAISRRHRGIEQEALERTHTPSRETENRLGRVVGAATGVSTLILLVLIVISVRATSATMHPTQRTTGSPLTVEVQGNQWWWYIRYANDDASRIAVTANEMHVPVGRPVMIRGTSADVIHSFWVPNLQGKRDLIPSRTTTISFRADRPGRYRGQCAEFCGLQHAHMALLVVAESQDDFQRWRKAQLADAKTPATPEQSVGRDVFLAKACAACHTVRGTSAAGSLGPDLTHVGGRQYIAAGMLPTTRGSLAAWVADPQTIKPGNNMPLVPLEPRELNALSAWLASLQ
jgi:cytochrome c oxidase subunit II